MNFLKRFYLYFLFALFSFPCIAQEHIFPAGKMVRNEQLTRRFIIAKRIVWKSGDIKNEEVLLKKGNGQAELSANHQCILDNRSNSKNIDFSIFSLGHKNYQVVKNFKR
ncbi:MAG: hypothetical protein EOO88_10430 [Pedobacter sp.]|nr:MAG: hypothetical protein EOO88_10430 [Pedobacter sp.]